MASAALQGCNQAKDAGPEDYNLRLHLAGVGFMLLASLAGALAPVALRLSSGSQGVTTGVRLGTYFGFGTILATALIHMLPPAAESLASPCLPAPFGGGGYGAWAYLFVLLAMLGMHLVDFLLKSHFSRRQHRQAQRQQQQLPEWHCSPALSPGLAHEGCPTHAAVASALAAGSIGAAARPQAAARQELAREGGAAAAEAGHHSGGTCSASSRTPPRHDRLLLAAHPALAAAGRCVRRPLRGRCGHGAAGEVGLRAHGSCLQAPGAGAL